MFRFTRADHMDMIKQHEELKNSGVRGVVEGNICRIFDEELEFCYESECAQYLGRIWALFGEPDDPKMYEDFYSYVVLAEDDNGNKFYMNIYEYCGMPSIGGIICEEYKDICKKAALELKKLINKTKPIDYIWSGRLEDFDVGMVYYVKKGVGYAKDDYMKKSYVKNNSKNDNMIIDFNAYKKKKLGKIDE